MSPRAPRAWSLMLAAGVTLVLLAGCGLHNPHPTGSFERGAYYAEQGNNLEAVAALESFIRHNPTDSLAAEAQFLKAKTYMSLKEFPLAVVEFQILGKDYPTSSFVEEGSYLEGISYRRQVAAIERDVTGAYEARLHFVDFLQRYPESKHQEDVRAQLQEISDLLVRKRLGQCKVYRQLGRHGAVAITLDDLLQYEAGSALVDEVLWERARTAEKLDDPGKAAEMYQRLIAEYPESEYGRRAGKALGGLDRGADDGS